MKRNTILWILLAFLCLSLGSCRKADAVPENGGSVSQTEETSPRILSNIYQGEGFPVPEGENMERFVYPEWDGETLWYVSVRYIREKDAEGNSTVRREWSLVQSSRTEVLTRIPLALPDGAVMPGMIRDGELVAGVQRWPEGSLDILLIRARTSDGEVQVSESLSPYFGADDIVWSMAFDGNGLLYLASNYRVFVFDGSLPGDRVGLHARGRREDGSDPRLPRETASRGLEDGREGDPSRRALRIPCRHRYPRGLREEDPVKGVDLAGGEALNLPLTRQKPLSQYRERGFRLLYSAGVYGITGVQYCWP